MTKKGRYVALLRGVNVGGKNLVPMATLAKLAAACGGEDVATFVQSGNVVFSASSAIARGFEKALAKGIADELGLTIAVVVRSHAEIDDIVKNGPFVGETLDPTRLHVLFLAEAPASEDVATLDPGRSPGDSFVVRGREVFLRLPNGAARTKLTTAYFDARLRTTSTGRNLRTVTKLAELTLS
jgi:uncharacterized protein (DUF1697 family)